MRLFGYFSIVQLFGDIAFNIANSALYSVYPVDSWSPRLVYLRIRYQVFCRNARLCVLDFVLWHIGRKDFYDIVVLVVGLPGQLAAVFEDDPIGVFVLAVGIQEDFRYPPALAFFQQQFENLCSMTFAAMRGSDSVSNVSS